MGRLVFLRLSARRLLMSVSPARAPVHASLRACPVPFWRHGMVVLVMALVWFPASWFNTAWAATPYVIVGRVIHVSDGDTLSILMDGQRRQRVRLASIDAPETGHGRKRPGQPYSQAARKALAELVQDQTVTLQCYEQDHYGREICDVPLDDGRQASHVLVENGLAWANQQGGGKYLRDRRLIALEQQARQKRRGLWQHANPVAPWTWRWACWKALETGASTPIC